MTQGTGQAAALTGDLRTWTKQTRFTPKPPDESTAKLDQTIVWIARIRSDPC